MQQSLQPKLSHRCYASVLYALQNNTVFKSHRTESVSVETSSSSSSYTNFIVTQVLKQNFRAAMWPLAILTYPAVMNQCL